ncbi:hypothetical protein ACFPIF_15680 [Brevundimonas faecalis]|uniref:hypothetical protein n=1 Tax=Brevundimonas faecalis TaxID=947378 RepID=UPI003622B185
MARFRICRVHERHGKEHYIVEYQTILGRWKPIAMHCARYFRVVFETKKAAQDWIDEEKRDPVHECGEVQ